MHIFHESCSGFVVNIVHVSSNTSRSKQGYLTIFTVGALTWKFGQVYFVAESGAKCDTCQKKEEMGTRFNKM